GSRLPLSCQPATGGAPGQAVCIFPQGEGLAWLQSGLRSPRAAGAVRRAEGGALGTPRNVKSALFRPSGTFSRKGRRTACARIPACCYWRSAALASRIARNSESVPQAGHFRELARSLPSL